MKISWTSQLQLRDEIMALEHSRYVALGKLYFPSFRKFVSNAEVMIIILQGCKNTIYITSHTW